MVIFFFFLSMSVFCFCQPGRDAKGAALALFTARLHRPDVTTHKAVLQAIIYQLDKAIEKLVPFEHTALLFFILVFNQDGLGNQIALFSFLLLYSIDCYLMFAFIL